MTDTRSRVERATRRAGTTRPAITLNGRAVDIPDFDAMAFAKTLRKRAAVPATLEQKKARLARLAVKHAH